MKLILKSVCVAFVLTVILTMLPFEARCGNISNEIFRLHILANSDSQEDQQLKLKVRDAVLERTEELYAKAQTKEEALRLTRINLREIEKTAQETVNACGYSYPVTARIANIYFNTRHYDDVTMPSGFYDALQIEIGSGEGQNWWCVMYPSLCVGAAADSEILKKELDDDEMSIVTSEGEFTLRFKLLEYFESFKNWLYG